LLTNHTTQMPKGKNAVSHLPKKVADDFIEIAEIPATLPPGVREFKGHEFKVTQAAARRIQSEADKTGKRQDIKASAMHISHKV